MDRRKVPLLFLSFLLFSPLIGAFPAWTPRAAPLDINSFLPFDLQSLFTTTTTTTTLSPTEGDEPSNRLLPSDLDKLPPCERHVLSCASDLADTWAALLKMGSNHIERYHSVCSEYKEALDCIAAIEGCQESDQGMLSTLTAGIRYMCTEQKDAFNATIACVDAAAIEVQGECDAQCNAQAVMMKWAVQTMSRMGDGGGLLGGGGSGGLLDNLLSGLGGGVRSAPVSVGRVKGSDEETRKDEDYLVSEDESAMGRGPRRRRQAAQGEIFSRSGPLGIMNGIERGLNNINRGVNDESRAVLGSIKNTVQSFFPDSADGSSPFAAPSSAVSPSSRGLFDGSPTSSGGFLPPGLLRGAPAGEGVPLIDLSTMRAFSADFCQISECFLGCLKNKLNARCEGSAGTLISEVFMRPLAKTQESFSSMPMASGMFGMFLPEQCRFLYDTNRMRKYRVDETLDQDLKRTYRERQEALEKEKNDLTFGPSLSPAAISPMDSYNSLDELIDQHYRSQENETMEEGSGKEKSPFPSSEVIVNGTAKEGSGELETDGLLAGDAGMRKVEASEEVLQSILSTGEVEEGSGGEASGMSPSLLSDHFQVEGSGEKANDEEGSGEKAHDEEGSGEKANDEEGSGEKANDEEGSGEGSAEGSGDDGSGEDTFHL